MANSHRLLKIRKHNKTITWEECGGMSCPTMEEKEVETESLLVVNYNIKL